jgi:hypothetical protein
VCVVDDKFTRAHIRAERRYSLVQNVRPTSLKPPNAVMSAVIGKNTDFMIIAGIVAIQRCVIMVLAVNIVLPVPQTFIVSIGKRRRNK